VSSCRKFLFEGCGMTYYRGSRVPLSEKGARSYSINLGWKGRKAAGEEKKHFLRILGSKEKPVVHDEPKVHTFYRPGVTPAEDTPSFSRKTKSWVPKGPALGGMKWALRLAGLVLLAGVVLWSKQKTTALLQDVAGLKLGKVSVAGNRYLSDEEITKALGLAEGENMFKLDLEQATERIKKLDWVERVFIERRLPSSLLVSIRERKPVALLDNGTLYGVDGEGRVLSPSTALLNEDLPLISGVTMGPDAAGTTRMAETLKPALDFFAFLKRKDGVLAADVSEVNLSDRDSLKVTFIDGIQAAFDPPVTETQLRRMTLVLSDLNQKEKRAGTMDFRYRDMVLVKTR
jgi:cell division protein FtsQ